MLNNRLKYKFLELIWATIAISAASVVIYFGNHLLNVSMDVFYGVGTFNPKWILNLFLIPVIAGIVVSLIYGLGGKMLAHLAPLPVMVFNYVTLDKMLLPEGVTQLPIYYWALVVIVAVEFAGIGGVIGEVMIKKTYGRSQKKFTHIRYQQSIKERLDGKDEKSLSDVDVTQG